ncbi:MAG: septum formation initiator family protein [Candidatus Omnitrophica bacterium]|nr:septum formation initiator family protein [Candidatus Omnitrophota bacterium]
MRVKRSSIDYIKVLLAFFILSVVFGIFVVFYFPNFAKLKELKRANEQLTSEIANLKKEISDLQEKGKKVTKDPALFEKLAREDLGVARKDEIVIDIQE